MNSPDISDFIEDDELLARFVMFSNWIRADGSLKQDAFIPPKDLNLSVTRHHRLSDGEIWQRGQDCASKRAKTLLGRADISAASVREIRTPAMNVIPDPEPENPEHCNIVGWPPDKPTQKSIAQRLAAAAAFVSLPASL